MIGLGGEIDAEVLPVAVADAAGEDYSAVVFDLAAVRRVDAGLLSAVLRCEAGLAVSGVEVRLRNLSPRAERMLTLTGLTSLLE